MVLVVCFPGQDSVHDSDRVAFFVKQGLKVFQVAVRVWNRCVGLNNGLWLLALVLGQQRDRHLRLVRRAEVSLAIQLRDR